jgi:hypothetical protein
VTGDDPHAVLVAGGHATDEFRQQAELAAEHGVHHEHFASVEELL